MVEPRLRKSSMDIELPICETPYTLHEDPKRENDRTLKHDARELQSWTEIVDPIRHVARMEQLLPRRATCRRERELPIVPESKHEIIEPNRAIPKMDMEEPNRMYPRRLNVEPITALSSVERSEPMHTFPNTERELPIRM
jgi:hypothetical protein